MGYKEDFIDLVDAANKASYARFNCNAKKLVLDTKKGMSSRLKNSRPAGLYKIERAIYLLSMRNNMGHGAFRIANVSKEDVCIVFEVFAAAYYDKLENKGFTVKVAPNGQFYVTRNDKLYYHISAKAEKYRQNDNVSYLINELL